MLFPSSTSLDDLTPREREVAELVARGLIYREVGDELGIAERTVKAHVLSAAAKLPGSGRPNVKVARIHHLLAASDSY